MIKHNACGHVTSEIRITGPVLWATGVVEFADASPKLVSISPFTAIQTVQAGEELISDAFDFECPKCHEHGKRDQFTFVATCIFTDAPTEYFVTTAQGKLPVVESMHDLALTVFSDERGVWETMLTEKDIITNV